VIARTLCNRLVLSLERETFASSAALLTYLYGDKQDVVVASARALRPSSWPFSLPDGARH